MCLKVDLAFDVYKMSNESKHAIKCLATQSNPETNQQDGNTSSVLGQC